MTPLPSVAHSRDNVVRFFTQFVSDPQNKVAGKTVIDLSAGSGYIAHLFEKAGAKVFPFDLFPNQNKHALSKCQKIDLQKPFPIQDATADLVICSETIEHLPNQLFLFQETERILKPSGVLILTTPNTSSLRSRFAQFMMESEHYSSPSPNELDAFVDWGNGDSYFGKLFLSGVLRIRTLAALNRLRIKKIYKSPPSSTSILLLICYPILLYFNWRIKQRQVKRDPANKEVFEEIFSINTSFQVLTGKHLIISFEKQ
jgi:SAM-dependent methyltransferase